MAFSLDNISGVTNQFLNDASRNIETDRQRTKYIPYQELVPSALNKDLSKDNIDELAAQIEQEGMDQPLVVTKMKNGKYEILGGERRFLAVGKLIEQGKYNEDQLVECKVKEFPKKKNGLTAEEQKIFTWLTTNQYREKTDHDKYIESLRWKEIVLKLRKQGINMLMAGYDEDGNVISKDMTGIKTRKLVADQMGISTTQVQKIEEIEAKGSDALKEALKNDRINIAGAAALARLSKEDQDMVLEEQGEDVPISSKVITKNVEEKSALVETDLKAAIKDIGALNKKLTKSNTVVKLNKAKRNKLEKAVNTIKEIIEEAIR